MDDELTRRGVSLTSSDTKPGEKMALIEKRMKEGGFTRDEIIFQQKRHVADTETNKVNDAFRDAYKHLRWGDEGWDLPVVKKFAEGTFKKVADLRRPVGKWYESHRFSF